jgi:putative hydrolase of the HAD superfamily
MRHIIDKSNIDIVLFDLGNTLYTEQEDKGLWDEIDKRIQTYVGQVLQLPPTEASILQRHYWRLYGSTMAGLVIEHGLDPESYLRTVYQFDPSVYLDPDPVLYAMLAALPYRKAIFTNASVAHAQRVLTALGVVQLFDAITRYTGIHSLS